MYDAVEHDFAGERHMIVSGKLVMKNSDGYLSAELRSHQTVQLLCVLAWAVMLVLWIYQYKAKRELFITLNYHLGGILLFGLFESFFGYVNYLVLDHYQEPNLTLQIILGFLVVSLTVGRSVYARIIVLSIALGWQVVIRSVDKYKPRIGIAAFLYGATLVLG